MKRIVFVLFCALLSFNAIAQKTVAKELDNNLGVKWEKGTLTDALDKAKKSKKTKLVFVDCYTVWCGPCKQMAEKVFPLKEAGDYFNANYVNIKIDMEKGEGVEIAKKYQVSSFPTFLILDANGKELGRVIGSSDLNKFITKVEDAKDINNSPNFIKSVYDKDKSFDNALAYIKILYSSRMVEKMKEFIASITTDYKNSQLFSTQMWPYYSKCIDIPSIYKHLSQNRAEANIIVGKEKIDELLLENSTSSLMKYLLGRSELSPQDIDNNILIISLLSKTSDTFPMLISKLAEYYTNNQIDKIVSLYKIELLSMLPSMQLSTTERIFASIKGITKQDNLNYFKAKEEFYSRQVRACSGRIKALEQ